MTKDSVMVRTSLTVKRSWVTIYYLDEWLIYRQANHLRI